LSIRTSLVCAAAAGVVLGAASLPRQAFAGERIALSNGFEIRCDHHAQVGSQVRLYFTPDDNNYIERKPEEITGVEHVADPPPGAAKSNSAKAGQDAKLSQADLHEMLAQAGQQHHLDVDLLASVVKAESNGNVNAVSRAGARGLMQLMPKTASDHGVNDSFRPDENVRGGSAYLDEMLARYHDNLALALAAYNAGPAAVDEYHGIPPYHETQVYVARVIHEFNRRVLVRQGGQARRGDGPRGAHTPQPGAPSANLAAASTR
jgi:Transglycosylase SLT domain